MLRLDRSRSAGPLLEWKIRLFVVGAGLGLAGIFMEDRRLTAGAIVVLATGALLRFLPGASEVPPSDDDEAEDEADVHLDDVRGPDSSR